MPGLIPYPLINGNYYSFSSIECAPAGIPMTGIKAINYKDSLKGVKVRGTAPQAIGRTRGDQDASGDIEIYRPQWELFRAALGVVGVGFGELAFDIPVQYAELPTLPVVTDLIVGARLEEIDSSNAQGADPSTVKLTLSVMRILWGGVPIAFPDKVPL